MPADKNEELAGMEPAANPVNGVMESDPLTSTSGHDMAEGVSVVISSQTLSIVAKNPYFIGITRDLALPSVPSRDQ